MKLKSILLAALLSISGQVIAQDQIVFYETKESKYWATTGIVSPNSGKFTACVVHSSFKDNGGFVKFELNRRLMHEDNFEEEYFFRIKTNLASKIRWEDNKAVGLIKFYKNGHVITTNNMLMIRYDASGEIIIPNLKRSVVYDYFAKADYFRIILNEQTDTWFQMSLEGSKDSLLNMELCRDKFIEILNEANPNKG